MTPAASIAVTFFDDYAATRKREVMIRATDWQT